MTGSIDANDMLNALFAMASSMKNEVQELRETNNKKMEEDQALIEEKYQKRFDLYEKNIQRVNAEHAKNLNENIKVKQAKANLESKCDENTRKAALLEANLSYETKTKEDLQKRNEKANQEIGQLQANLDKENQKTQQLEKDLSGKSQQVDDMKDSLLDQNQQILDLNTKIDDKELDIKLLKEDLKGENDEKEKRLKDLGAKCQEVINNQKILKDKEDEYEVIDAESQQKDEDNINLYKEISKNNRNIGELKGKNEVLTKEKERLEWNEKFEKRRGEALSEEIVSEVKRGRELDAKIVRVDGEIRENKGTVNRLKREIDSETTKGKVVGGVVGGILGFITGGLI